MVEEFKIQDSRFKIQDIRCKIMLYPASCILHPVSFYLSFILFLGTQLFAFSDDALSIADDLASQKRYDESITEYKRFIFFNQEDPRIAEADYKIGMSYRAEGNLHQAITNFDKSIALTKDPNLADQRRLTLATTLIASQNYNLARLELAKILNSTKDESLLKKTLYFSGIEAIYMRDWESVEAYFGRYYLDDEKADKLNSIFRATRQSYKSPTTAKLLSVFIPGAGQIYSGYWKDGLNAFVLNGAIIGGVAYNVHKKHYNNAIIVAYLLLIRYYNGNIYHAGKDAEKHNQALDNKTAIELLRTVSANEP
jgi:tetratricopeptide (TPR) repeat protein